MPRQPLRRALPGIEEPTLKFGITTIESRPELAPLQAMAGKCMTMWSYVEAEMGLLLAVLLNAANAPTLAVFQVLRRSSAQREAISAAAQASQDAPIQELIGAILDAHKSIEADRNAIAHGLWGTCTQLKNGLVWIPSPHMALTLARIYLDHEYGGFTGSLKDLADAAFVYKHRDFQSLHDDIVDLWFIWANLILILQLPKDHRRRAELYLQLCAKPRIAQELAKARRENIPSAPRGSRRPRPKRT